MDIINIVTPVSRPENLAAIAADIEARIRKCQARWYCIFDKWLEPPPRMEKPFIAYWGQTGRDGRFGNGCRNTALDMIDSGWVYFLDDDNTLHPDFEEAFLEARRAYPEAAWFVFGQIRPDGRFYLAATDRPRVNFIDSGQCIVLRAAIGDLRFDPLPYNADGIFYENLAKRVRPIAIQKEVTFYNALR